MEDNIKPKPGSFVMLNFRWVYASPNNREFDFLLGYHTISTHWDRKRVDTVFSDKIEERSLIGGWRIKAWK